MATRGVQHMCAQPRGESAHLVRHLAHKLAEAARRSDARLFAAACDGGNTDFHQAWQDLAQCARRVDHDALPHVHCRVPHRR